MAAKIYADTLLSDNSAANYSRRYTSFADAEINDGHKIGYYLQQTTDIEGDRISTYLTENHSLPAGVEDFACVVIAGTNQMENSQLINRYIQLVTNTTDDYLTNNQYHKIAVSTCKYENGHFMDIGNANTALSFTNGTGFTFNQDYADSHSNAETFTLVDVQFTDPLNTDAIAYHLYVPVYTIRQMTVEFYAAAKTASDSVKYSNNGYSVSDNSYNELLDSSKTLDDIPAHFDSFDSWFTMYLRYRYNPTDINTLLEAGNVNWNYPKYATFTVAGDENAERLPDQTYMVLVDANGNGDKAYTASISASGFQKSSPTNAQGVVVNTEEYKKTITFNLSAFTRNNTAFEVKPLRDVIATKIQARYSETGYYYHKGTVKPQDYDTGNYVYTIENGTKHYYEYKSDKSGDYNITATGYVDEDYYINTYVLEGIMGVANDIVFYGITGPDRFSAPVAGAKAADVKLKRNYFIVVGDLFEQITSGLEVFPENEEINVSRHELQVYAKTEVYLKNGSIGAHLQRTTQDIFHSLNLNLDQYDKDGVIKNDIYGLGDPVDEEKETDAENTMDGNSDRFIAYYSNQPIIHDAAGNPTSINSCTHAFRDEVRKSLLNVVTHNINKTTLGKATKAAPYTIYTYANLNFNTDQLEQEFPTKQGKAGVKVRVDSLLAYDKSKVRTSNMIKSYPADHHKYYMESINSAKLTYMAKTGTTELDEFDSTGKNSENYSRLGINGISSDADYMPINTVANYNAQALGKAEVDKASAMRIEMRLFKKMDFTNESGITKVEYVDVTKTVSGESSGKTLADYFGDEVVFTSGGITRTVKLSELDDKRKISLILPASETINGKKMTWSRTEDDIFTTEISYSAKTKTGFKEYANYKVELTITLLEDVRNEENEVTGRNDIELSMADDYLVYTNAKVNHDYV